MLLARFVSADSSRKAAVHPPVNPRPRRRALFDRCLSHLPDPEKFLADWFQLSSSLDVKRDNYIDWVLWALFATDRRGVVDDPSIEEELNEYLTMIENKMGRKLEPGRNSSIKPMRLTLDPVVMLPRPMVWYVVSTTLATSLNVPPDVLPRSWLH